VLFRDTDPELFGRWRTWGLRFYGGAFITLGLFAIAYAVRHHETLRIAVKVVAGVAGAISVAMGVYGFSFWVRWVHYRRAQGARWR
jgi:hypothetical protein